MPEPVCDLVLLSWNHLEETQPCLESLFACTSVPCRLFIVDNGSEQPVRDFLSKVAPQGSVQEVIYLQNETNEGFPRGMNRGLRETKAPYACFLNNDLIFTPGWLNEMIAVAENRPSIGAVNPGSSNFGVHPPSADTAALNAWATQRLESMRGTVTEVGMNIGFCVLLKREVINKIGYLTEEVDRIFFEDEDYSMRVVEAGYQCVVADAAYVHHAEHKTMKPSPEREALFNKNKNWCERKYGKRLRIAWPHPQVPEPGSATLKEWLEQLIEWARRRTYIYVYCPMPAGYDKRRLFESVGLMPHADILWFPVAKSMPRAHAQLYILKRRKKRFSLIAAPDAGFGRVMEAWQWWHSAEIVSATNPTEIESLWKQKSRLPLSS